MCPCHGCVAPKRCVGCHDSCADYAAYRETDMKMKREYEKKYLSGMSCYSTSFANKIARKRKQSGDYIYSYGHCKY